MSTNTDHDNGSQSASITLGPEQLQKLDRLLNRADDLDQLVDRAQSLNQNLPGLLAMAVDVLDGMARNASQQGIDIEQRAQGLLQLLILFTEPQTLNAAEQLLKRLPSLEAASRLLDDLPGLAATLADVFDEWAATLKKQDISLEASLRQGLHAALYLGQRIGQEELDRIDMLLRSGVLDKDAVQAVGMAGAALARCQRGTCEAAGSQRTGLFGLLRALRDPNTQRSIAFALRFSECFGNSLCEQQSGTESRESN
jgi:ElaB/YqjD/DUF883 family membrane-anchored ribosome-binding protein